MVITEDIIEEGLSSNGCLSLKQVKLLLPQWEVLSLRPGQWPKKGWKFRILGRNVSKEVIAEFLELKDKHLERTSENKEKTGILFT